MTKALVLNATYEPLCVVPVRRAVILVLKDKAEILHAPTASCIPSARRCRCPRSSASPTSSGCRSGPGPRLNRRAVFARDDHRCQYCGDTAENIDHVVPRSRGGEHVWENVVASCKPCNSRKEDRLVHEVGFVLRRRPTAPKELTWIIVAVGTLDPRWEPYLQAGAALSA